MFGEKTRRWIWKDDSSSDRWTTTWNVGSEVMSVEFVHGLSMAIYQLSYYLFQHRTQHLIIVQQLAVVNDALVFWLWRNPARKTLLYENA